MTRDDLLVLMLDVDRLLSRAYEGDHIAIAKIISLVEYPSEDGEKILSKLMSKSGKAHVIGVTGAPGSGKSTLIARLIGEYRRRGSKVAVVAVDPTSPFTQGALMGDRIRMQRYTTDPGVFIRSLATRGERGGISTAALLTIEVFDGLGYDKIFLETVGVGQVDIDAMHAAHTIVVLSVPGTGDEIQALKAGIMEIGDIYVVSKGDKPEADETLRQIRFAIEGGVFRSRGGWTPSAIKVSSVTGEGVDDLVRLIEKHYSYIVVKGVGRERLRERRIHTLKSLLLWIVESRFNEMIEEKLSGVAEKVVSGEMGPYSAVSRLLKAMF